MVVSDMKVENGLAPQPASHQGRREFNANLADQDRIVLGGD